MRRRSLLATCGATITAISSGCLGIVSSDSPRDYTYSVYNGSQESHSFRLRIGNTVDGGHFHQETLELDAQTGSEDIPIDDVPSHVYITIDSFDEHEFRWPASHSELGKIALRAEIAYEPIDDQELFVLSG